MTLEALEAADAPARDALLLLPVDAPLAAMPRLEVDADVALALIQGRTVGGKTLTPSRYRCYAPMRFLGIVDVAGNVIHPLRMARLD